MPSDAALTELEDRGLLGWDKTANRYDLHPIVRGVVWGGLGDETKQGVYEVLHSHFEAIPDKHDHYTQVESLEDLTPAIELYNTLIGLGRYEEAGRLFYERLNKAMHFRLSSNRQRIELLERLFPDGLDQLPRRKRVDGQAFILNALALAYKNSGQPGQAVPLSFRDLAIDEARGELSGVAITLRNLSDALRLSGGLYAAEVAARRALIITREQEDRFGEAVSLQWLGLVLSACGKDVEDMALQRSLRIFIGRDDVQAEGVVNAYLAQTTLWRGDYQQAKAYADKAWELAHHRRAERDFIRSALVQGAAALGLGDFDTADERLHHALTRARAVNLVEHELEALIGLAELARQRDNPDEARRLLDDVWEAAERGPYPLYHADAKNVLAQLERAAGNTEAAIQAAQEAYELAWCDGISTDGQHYYAYHWGLEKAKAHLDALGATYPKMPPFDPSQHDPLPEVDINPPGDEYSE